jgi:hypothetical protein
MSAELAARVTAAEAVLADFRAALASAPLTSPPPMGFYAFRLADLLGDLLAELDAPGPGAADPDLEHDPAERTWLARRLLTVLPVAEPADVDRDTADYLAALPGDVCQVVTGWLQQRQAASGVSPEAGKLDAIRGVLDTDDRDAIGGRSALERIEQIAGAPRNASGV